MTVYPRLNRDPAIKCSCLLTFVKLGIFCNYTHRIGTCIRRNKAAERDSMKNAKSGMKYHNPTIEACVAGYGRHYRFLVLYISRVNLFLTKRFDHTTVVFFRQEEHSHNV